MPNQQAQYRQQSLRHALQCLGFSLLLLGLIALYMTPLMHLPTSSTWGEIIGLYKQFVQNPSLEMVLIVLAGVMAGLHLKQYWFYRRLTRVISR